jgi:colicin import membrane protein
MQDASQTQVTIRIRFRKDGTLAIGPQVITSGSGAQFAAMRDSAVRAVFVGQPYTMLRPEHYEQWKEIDFTFDTRQMFHDLPARQ